MQFSPTTAKPPIGSQGMVMSNLLRLDIGKGLDIAIETRQEYKCVANAVQTLNKRGHKYVSRSANNVITVWCLEKTNV